MSIVGAEFKGLDTMQKIADKVGAELVIVDGLDGKTTRLEFKCPTKEIKDAVQVELHRLIQ